MRDGSSAAVEAIFAPADRVRRGALAAVARVARPLIVERELRIAVVATVAIAAALVGTAFVPLWLLLVGPIVLGVPHVLGDVRYLVMRPALQKRWLLWALVGVPLVWSAFGGGVRAGLVATCGALVAARGRPSLRAAGVGVAIALFAFVVWVGPVADLAFAHLHNFVAVGVWWAWRRRAGRLHWFPLGVFVVGCALLLVGFAEPRVADFPYAAGEGLVPLELAALGGRLVAVYAFAQAVHYTVWLRLVPEEDRAQPTPRSWTSTWRALRADLGPWLLAGGALASIALAAFALVDLVQARDTYLRMAIFHGHLELAAVALLFVEGRLPHASRAPRGGLVTARRPWSPH